MKRRFSIKLKFFAAIFIVAVLFITLLTVLNLFFYDDYYSGQRRHDLIDTYHQVEALYTGDVSAASTALDVLENSSGVRIAIANEDGNLLYISSFRHGGAENDAAPADVDKQIPLPETGSFVPPDDFAFERNDIRKSISTAVVMNSVFENCDLNAVQSFGYQLLTPALGENEKYLCIIGTLSVDGQYCIGYIPTALIQQNSSFNLVFLLITGSIALLVCAVLGYFISRQFTRPLIRMTEIATSMAQFDFSNQYMGTETDEIGQLGQSINRLSAYLEQAIGELQQTNTKLAQEIREKERIDNMRREFIINVSHELKTPIALIQGYAEGLQCGVADNPEDRRFYCDTITDEAAHMNHLVMQLLNLSKLEIGSEQLNLETVDLYTLCEGAVRKTAVLCETKSLSVDYENTHVSLRTDSDLLDQVLMNYLSNAIRYTAEGGRIEIAATVQDDCFRLTVFNEGGGLPDEELPKIWEKFYRTDSARSRESGGTGIGLSLVRAIADTLGGTCGAENVPGGIRFYLELPRP